MRFRRRIGGLDPDVGFLARLGEGGEARQQQFVGKKWRYVQANDRAAESHLQLLGDRFKLRKYIVNVLEVMAAGIGQGQGASAARAALKQGHAQLFFQCLDLVAHGGRRDIQLLCRRLETLKPGCDLEGLQEAEGGKAHHFRKVYVNDGITPNSAPGKKSQKFFVPHVGASHGATYTILAHRTRLRSVP